jgi:hypothetical protein
MEILGSPNLSHAGREKRPTGKPRFLRAQAHEITESLIEKIEARMPDADVTVHYDPEGET